MLKILISFKHQKFLPVIKSSILCKT